MVLGFTINKDLNAFLLYTVSLQYAHECVSPQLPIL